MAYCTVPCGRSLRRSSAHSTAFCACSRRLSDAAHSHSRESAFAFRGLPLRSATAPARRSARSQPGSRANPCLQEPGRHARRSTRLPIERDLHRPLKLHGNRKRQAVKDRRMDDLQSQCRPAPASQRLVMAANAGIQVGQARQSRSRRVRSAGCMPPARRTSARGSP